MWIPVQGGLIRALHVRPNPAPGPITVRPVVFVPGWGTGPAGFTDFYEVLHDRAELYYIETREKGSSRLDRGQAEFSVERSARDLAAALRFLELDGSDFVLMGACWGSTMILQGLIAGLLQAPTLVLADPMHALWYPRWFLTYVSPLMPVSLAELLRPLLKGLALFGMKEPVQRRRSAMFIDSAVIWKWKKAAEAARDFDLYGRLGAVREEVFVLNGTADKIHRPVHYPRIAGELPRGRFLSLKADESLRERLLGLTALEFARVPAGQGLPPALAGFEKPLR